MTSQHPTSPPLALDDTQPIQPVPPEQEKTGSLSAWLVRLPVLFITGGAMLVIVLALFVAAHETHYSGRIYPGVSTFGTDLTGMTYGEALAILEAAFVYDDETVFTFTDGAQSWAMTAGELGVSFDAAQTASTALLVGRGGSLVDNLAVQLDVWANGQAVSPVVVYDQTIAENTLSAVAGDINRGMQEASLVLMGTDIIAAPSQIGRMVDVSGTLAMLRSKVIAMEPGGVIPLQIIETLPEVASVDEAESRLRAALAGPIMLTADAGGPWTASVDQIAAMLTVQRQGNEYSVTLDMAQFESFLGGIAPQLVTEAKPARFNFDVATNQLVVLEDSVDGRDLDITSTLASIESILFVEPAAPGISRDVPLTFALTPPAVNSKATGTELGIIELVGEATTYYLGSTATRQRNINEAASRFDGIVIGPGEEFSFNHFLGDVSLDSGFEESAIIVGGRTIKGVGGGVCQVSTTVFQAAFYTGYPIVERYAHGYRVGYYEYGEGVGMDATVYSPIVDFRFLNDTPYHLLIEVDVNQAASSLSFRFYSTDVGREVVKLGPRVTNEQPAPATVYEENPDLYAGQTRQVEWAVAGADVTVTRQVFVGGQLEQEDHFFSGYVPWASVIQVAPGELPNQTGG